MLKLSLASAVILALFAVPMTALAHGSGEHGTHGGHEAKQAAPEAGVIALDVVGGAGAPIDLLTAEANGKGGDVSLLHRRSTDSGKTFSEPHAIRVDGFKIYRPKRGFDPRIAASGDKLAVVWTEPGEGAWGDGALALATSIDGGMTWKKAANPADDGSKKGHGLMALRFDSKGSLHAIWLDDRDGKTGLRYAKSSDLAQSWSKNQTLDGLTCECCWNSLYELPDGRLSALYRQADPRDMALTTSIDGGNKWEKLGLVGDFRWKFNGCPHEGGGLAWLKPEGGDDSLHAVVWNGDDTKPGKEKGLYALASSDKGKSWPTQILLAAKGAQHPDLAADAGSRLAAVWDQGLGRYSTIEARLSRDQGKTWEKVQTISARGLMRASHPRLVASSNGFVAFWTESRPGRTTIWNHKTIASE